MKSRSFMITNHCFKNKKHIMNVENKKTQEKSIFENEIYF